MRRGVVVQSKRLADQYLNLTISGDVGCRFMMSHQSTLLNRVKTFKDAHPELAVHYDGTLPGVRNCTKLH